MSEEIRMAWIDRRTGKPLKISRPLPTVRSLFTLPPPQTVLWKYGDYHKFAQLFSQGTLYFRRADQLPDIYEGRFTAANQERQSDMFDAAFRDLGLGDAAPILRMQESHRNHTFLSCWHKNSAENARMWREYTKSSDAIVLVTDLSSLFAATPTECKGADVHYVAENEPLPELHSLAALVHKRRDPYEFESEFRLLCMLPLGKIERPETPEDYGRLIPADAARLLKEVRFHPQASAEFKARVRVDVAAAGLNVPLRDSAFADEKPA
jgi:hypothetical protein